MLFQVWACFFGGGEDVWGGWTGLGIALDGATDSMNLAVLQISSTVIFISLQVHQSDSPIFGNFCESSSLNYHPRYFLGP